MINKLSIILSFCISLVIVVFFYIFIGKQPIVDNINKLFLLNFFVFFLFFGIFSLSSYSWLTIKRKFSTRSPINKLNKILDNSKFSRYVKVVRDNNLDKDSEELILEVEDVKLFARNPIEIALINNIYIKKVYGYFFTNPTIVMDIGANIGYSAIWFAKENLVEKVFAYEPVLPTFLQAKRNIDLNPTINNKIIINNFGLSNNYEKMEISFSKEHHTISSTILPKEKNKQKGKPRKPNVTVELRDIKKEIIQIIDYKIKNNCKLLLKIDCEGSEFKILNSFTNIIWDEIDIILMEVHGVNYEELIDLLNRKKFDVFNINHDDHHLFDHLCDLYAIKSTSH